MRFRPTTRWSPVAPRERRWRTARNRALFRTPPPSYRLVGTECVRQRRLRGGRTRSALGPVRSESLGEVEPLRGVADERVDGRHVEVAVLVEHVVDVDFGGVEQRGVDRHAGAVL